MMQNIISGVTLRMQLIKENSYILKRSVPAMAVYMLWYGAFVLTGNFSSVQLNRLPYGLVFLVSLVHGAILGLVGGIIIAFFLKSIFGRESTEYVSLSKRWLLCVFIFGISYLGMWWFQTRLISIYSSLTLPITQENLFEFKDTSGLDSQQLNWVWMNAIYYIPISCLATIAGFIAFFYLKRFHSGFSQTELAEHSSLFAKRPPKVILHMAIWGMTGLHFLHFWLDKFLTAFFLPDKPQYVPSLVDHMANSIYHGGLGVILACIIYFVIDASLEADNHQALNVKKIYLLILLTFFLSRTISVLSTLTFQRTYHVLYDSPMDSIWALSIVNFLPIFLWLIPTYHYLSRFNKWWLWDRPKKKVDY